MIFLQKTACISHVRFKSEFDTRKQSTLVGGDFLRRTSSSRLQMFFKIVTF